MTNTVGPLQAQNLLSEISGLPVAAVDVSATTVKAAGSTTPITLAAWEAFTANVKAFGAVGDGVTDDTIAVQAAVTAGSVFFPTGTYLISEAIAVPSNRSLRGVPGQSFIKAVASGSWNYGNTPGVSTVAILANTGFTYPTFPSTPGTRNTSVTVDGLGFDLSNYATTSPVSTGVFFVGAAQVKLLNCTCAYGGSLIQAPNCLDVTVQGCRHSNAYGASVDFWGGASDIKVLANRLESVAGNVNFLVQYNAVGSAVSPQEFAARTFRVIGNTLIGSTTCGGISAIPLGVTSTVDDVQIIGNTVEANFGFAAWGGVTGAKVIGNTFKQNLTGGASAGAPMVWFDAGSAGGGNNTGYPSSSVIDGNTFLNWQQGTSPGVPISTYGHCTVNGNVTTGTYNYALYVQTGYAVIGLNSFAAGNVGTVDLVAGTGIWLDSNADTDVLTIAGSTLVAGATTSGTNTLNISPSSSTAQGTTATFTVFNWPTFSTTVQPYFYVHGYPSGACTSGQAVYNFIAMDNDGVNTTGAGGPGGATVFAVSDVLNDSGATGTRTAVSGGVNIYKKPGDSGDPTGVFYVGGAFSASLTCELGTVGTPRGQLFGINPIVQVSSAAQHLLAATGMEIDMMIDPSAGLVYRYGFQLFADGAQGVLSDIGITISKGNNNNAGQNPGWAIGLSFGAKNGPLGVSASGTLIGYQQTVYPGFTTTVANGVDWSALTFTSYFLRSANFSVDGSGNVATGASGAAGSLTIYPSTASKGHTVFTATNNSGDTVTTITTAAQAGTRTYTIPDAGASTSFLMSIMPALSSSTSYANDGAAAAGGVAVGQFYRNGSVVQIRVS